MGHMPVQVLLDIRLHNNKPSLRLPGIIVSRAGDELYGLEASLRCERMAAYVAGSVVPAQLGERRWGGCSCACLEVYLMLKKCRKPCVCTMQPDAHAAAATTATAAAVRLQLCMLARPMISVASQSVGSLPPKQRLQKSWQS